MRLLRIATGTLGVLAMLAGAACSRGGHDSSSGGGGGGGYVYSIPDSFSVVNTLPEDGASGVQRTQTVYIQFYTPIEDIVVNAATVNAATVTIQEGSNPVLPATVDCVTSWNYASIKAVSPLNPSTVYTVKVSAGVKNSQGNSLTPKTFTFTTSATGDVTPPTFAGATSAVKVSSPTHPFGIDVGWTQSGETPVEYDVFLSKVSGEFNYLPDLTVTDAASAIVDAGPNTSYYCKVTARDATGNVASNTFQFNATTDVSFQHNVWPVIQASCSSCHSPESSWHYDGTQPGWDGQVWSGSNMYFGFPDLRPQHNGFWQVQTMSMATPSQTYLNWVDSSGTYNYDGTGATVSYVVNGSSGEPAIPGTMRRIARPAVPGPADLNNSFLWQRLSTLTWGGQHPASAALSSGDQTLIQSWLTQGAKFN